MIRVLLLAIILSFSYSSLGEDIYKIVIIGDSLTEGYGIAKSSAYPYLVEKKLQKLNPKIQLINAGSSGSTSASAVSRMQWHLKAKPQMILLALGANDGLRGFSVEATQNNLQKAIDLAHKDSVKLILVGMKMPMNYGEKYRRDYENLFKTLAIQNKIPLIPFLLEGVATISELNLSDGIHPNEKGHLKMADTVFKEIIKHIPQKEMSSKQ